MTRTHFTQAPDAEISCEADPCDLTRAYLQTLRQPDRRETTIANGREARDKIEEQPAELQKLPLLVRSSFNDPSVTSIGDC